MVDDYKPDMDDEAEAHMDEATVAATHFGGGFVAKRRYKRIYKGLIPPEC